MNGSLIWGWWVWGHWWLHICFSSWAAVGLSWRALKVNWQQLMWRCPSWSHSWSKVERLWLARRHRSGSLGWAYDRTHDYTTACILHSGLIPFQSELEKMQQSSARSSTTLQSLRQQLAEAEERKQTSSSGLAELQTEIGRLRKELKDKVRLVNKI